MKNLAVFIITLLSYPWFACGLSSLMSSNDSTNIQNAIISTKRILLPTFPGAYNPSITHSKDGYLLTFRYLPNRSNFPNLSYIGIVRLNKSFEVISHSQLLNTRFNNDSTPSQSEDARIFSYRDRIFLFYNDNMEVVSPSSSDRRDIYMTELIEDGNQFMISDPLKLVHKSKYSNTLWQKNWSPFEWNGTLLLTYSINAHEIICPNLNTGICESYCETNKHIDWNYGQFRGGSPAQLVDGEYLAFFHSAVFKASPYSDNREMWHYYMGAYTFSSSPPFEINKISRDPIEGPGFYTFSSFDKRVIYPCGFVLDGNNIHVAYGKDDSEIWIATFDKNALKQSLISVN